MPDHCHFCGQIAGSPRRNLLKPLLGISWADRPILLEQGNAVLMPSVGALVSGHVLVCPREHSRSLAAASAKTVEDIKALTADATMRLSYALDVPVHTFEHGSGTDTSRVACSIEHAHLHLIPVDVEIRHLIVNLANWRPLPGDIVEVGAHAHGLEYLTYRAPDGEQWIATTEIGFPSQLLRRVFADAMQREKEWNWRLHPARDEVEATVELFAAPAAVGAHA